MSDLRHIRKVVSKTTQSAEIVDIPQVLRNWEIVLKKFAETEARLPEFEEFQALDKLPREVKKDFSSEEQARYKTTYYFYLLLKSFPSRSYADMHKLGLGNLFLALLQKYEIPTSLRKKVEAAAKFWDKTRLGDSKKGDEVGGFKKTLQIYRDHFVLAKAVVSQAVDRSTAEPGAVKTWASGPFRLLNTGGFDDKTMEDCAQVVEKATQLLKAKGLGKVCYGDIMISNAIGRSSRILAFYMPGKDEMFVRANLKNVKADAVQTVIHELAHRLQAKFLSGKQRQINMMYQIIDRKSKDSDREKLQAILDNPELQPKPGDRVTNSKGLTYEVDKVIYDEVQVHLVDEPKVRGRLKLLGYVQMKGIDVNIPERSGFVTHYAGKDADENFAEMVAFYCLDKLAPDQVEMLEPIIS